MKIGIIGSGSVGKTLGQAFLAEGHGVTLGTRDTAKAEVVKWKQDNPAGQTGSFSDAAQYGELLVLATGGLVTEKAIRIAGPEHFSGKVVIDVTNPIAPSAARQWGASFFYHPGRVTYGEAAAADPGGPAGKSLFLHR
jgi:predicted dinucleotide-binding enzyme